MLANLLIFLSASVAVLALLDFLMNDDQKKRVADIVLRIWNWLDEAKRVPILDMARTRRSQRILAGITISAICVPLLASLIWNVLNGKREYISTDVDIGFARITWLSIIGSWLGIAIILWLGRNIIPIILHGKTALQLFGRASLALVLAFVPILLIYSIAIWILVTFPAIETGLAFEFIALAMGFSIFATGILLLFWLVSASVVVLIYMGSLCLYMTEFTVRRIAEYPKGPVLAGSIVFGSVVALIKALEGG